MSQAYSHIPLLAHYNRWMNARLYAAAAHLTPEALARDCGGFFGSILGTLNHLVVGDTLWLQRFAGHPSRPAALAPVLALSQPSRLDEILFTELDPLRTHRAWLDACIEAWAGELHAEDLAHPLTYANTKGVVACKDYAALILHFFNHQTHHRGQASALLYQAGVDVGITDLLALVPNRS